MTRAATFVATFILSAAVSSLAADTTLPAPGQVPDGLGINIHFTDPRPGELEMLAAAGFRFVRMDFTWGGTEPARGHYDFSAYERLLAALDRHHIRAVLILDYSNPLYDDGLSPHSDEARAAFARWAAAAASHFKGRGVVWEVWNEPNIKQFWKPEPSANDYAKLALAASEAIHAAAPGELVVGPATSRVDFKFLETCFAAGTLRHWDAVSVHPYRQEDPETAAQDYAKLRALVTKYPVENQPPRTILSGEWGYSSGWKKFDETRQGKMLPRQFLTNLSEGIPLSIWYDWHDDGPDEKEPEHHFGTVHHEYRAGRDPVYDPKPAYLAAKTLTTVLRGYHFDRRVNIGAGDDYVLRFEKERDVILAAWTRSAQPRAVTVPAADGPQGDCVATGHTGDLLPAFTTTGTGLELALTDAPQYVRRRASAPSRQ